MRGKPAPTLNWRQIRHVKRLLTVSGPVDELRAAQYGIGSRLYMDVIEQALRWASCDPSSPTHKKGVSQLRLIQHVMSLSLRRRFPPEEAKARGACGLSFAWRYAHARPLPGRNQPHA